MTTAEELERRLAERQIVPLAVGEWEALAGAFGEVARHHTMVAGDLVLIRTRAGLAAVERPTPEQRVVRLLGDETAARSFVEARMALYERMWDGCGCKVDYYA